MALDGTRLCPASQASSPHHQGNTTPWNKSFHSTTYCCVVNVDAAAHANSTTCKQQVHQYGGPHPPPPPHHPPCALQAIVDDLRAEIASSRAELQQVKAAVQATPELN